MRQHASIWFLLIRGTFRRVLVIVLALALVQGGLFWWTMEKAWADAREAKDWYENESGNDRPADPEDFIWGVETVWQKSYGAVAFGVATVLTAVALVTFGTERNVKVSYTYRRLRVSERSIFAWQAVYNTLCFLLLWALEILIALALCKWYTVQVGPEHATHQAIFLAFYRNQFLHDLMPLENVMCWVRNGLLCLMLGTVAAWDTYAQRRSGKAHPAILAPLGIVMLSFLEGERTYGMYSLSIAASLFVIFIAVFRVLQKEGEYDEKA